MAATFVHRPHVDHAGYPAAASWPTSQRHCPPTGCTRDAGNAGARSRTIRRKVQETLLAAEQLSAEGIAAEVIDVATIKPLDADTICESVSRTGRLVIVHEAPVSGGYGGEVAACVAERALYSLQAPILRVAGYDTVMPLARLEHHYMPSVTRILRAARETLEAT